MTSPLSRYERATQETAENLQKVAESISAQKLTKLSLPEVDAVVDLVAKIIPAGNVPGMILSGLSRISGNKVQPQKARQDINILFKEVSLFFEQAKYGAFFGGPAAIIWGYQNLLKLAGKDPESAFPEGLWQFYADYALREDTARHANETHGFDTKLKDNNIKLSDTDRLTAWVMASVNCLHQYGALLECEWHERTALWLLEEITANTNFSREWEKQRPYTRLADGANYDYPSYRRIKFDQYIKQKLRILPQATQNEWQKKIEEAKGHSLEAYQKQMSILSYLDPNSYGENRTPYTLENAFIGIIYNSSYFLLPVCEPDTQKPLDVRTARSQIAQILNSHPRVPATLQNIARIKRSEVLALRKKLSPSFRQSLEILRYAPILINFDKPSNASLLSEIRQGERGIGDHALTIFDAGKTFVFDQSHIFFDGAWGVAFSEIMTNEALSWAVYLNMLSPVPPETSQKYAELKIYATPSDELLIKNAPTVSLETSAESQDVDIRACRELQRLFIQRSDLLKLSINDILVLYRAIHAQTYTPSIELIKTLDTLPTDIAKPITQTIESPSNRRPNILIPIDASKHTPKDRIYPLCIEVPLIELDLINFHNDTINALNKYEAVGKHDPDLYVDFDLIQRNYLAILGGFGTILAKAKKIAVQGESFTAGAIKLLAHIPTPIKHVLDKIPSYYEIVNNMSKGTEVLSNLGAVAPSSTLTRFTSAKDDNEQKQLSWGILTNINNVMTITLRDFRPHVFLLHAIGRDDIARQVTQEYLDTYALGLNKFVKEVSRIVLTHQHITRDRKETTN